jgi:hypothetical protein
MGRDCGDLREVGAVVIGNLVALAGFSPQHAREMPGIITGQLRAVTRDLVDKKSAPCQTRLTQPLRIMGGPVELRSGFERFELARQCGLFGFLE